MIDAVELVRCLSEYSFDPYLAVPCTLLKPLLSAIQYRDHGTLFSVPNEGDAIGIAAGAQLVGRNPVVVCQNSGIGNMMNPLTSLTHTFQIPLLLIVSWRGEPGSKDEPQHDLMGRITRESLTLLGVDNARLPSSPSAMRDCVTTAVSSMRKTSLPFALIVGKQCMDGHHDHIDAPVTGRTTGEVAQVCQGSTRMTRRQAIEIVMSCLGDDDLVLATTGLTSRELFTHCDRPGNFYVLGSMGCASTIGLGIASYYGAGKVVVLDGDGAALMRLQAMAAIGHYHPHNLVHVILDNACYDSTGGQSTISRTVQFAQVAQACGYAYSAALARPEDLREVVDRSAHLPGPHCIHIRLAAGDNSIAGRPSLTPVEIRDRFTEFARARTQAILCAKPILDAGA